MEECLVLILTTLVTLISYLAWKRYDHFKYFSKLGIPGPKPNFFFGNLKEIIEKESARCQTEWVKKYGNICGFFLGALPVVYVADLDLLKTILIKDFPKYSNRNIIFDGAVGFDPRMLNIIGAVRDQRWKNLRFIMSPIFSSAKLKTSLKVMDSVVERFLSKFRNGLGGSPINLAAEFEALSLENSVVSGMGLSPEILTAPFKKSMNDVLGLSWDQNLVSVLASFPSIQPIVDFILGLMLKIEYYLGYPNILYLLDACECAAIARAEQRGDQYQDMLQVFVDASELKNTSSKEGDKNVLNKNELIANIAVFLIAGYETTAFAFISMSHFLLQHPDVQEKVREEIFDVIGKESQITYESLGKLTYMEQVFNEALRLYPPSHTFTIREASETVTLGGKTIPKGTVLQVPMWALHHSPQLWTDPEEFIPERFTKDEEFQRDPMIYQPFGVGPRKCIGERFSKTFSRLVWARILREFRLELPDPEFKQNLEFKQFLFINRCKNQLMGKFVALSTKI